MGLRALKQVIFPIIIGVLILGTVSTNQQAFATVFQCIASLDGNQEVPSSGEVGTGTATATLNDVSNVLSWNIVYAGLTGPLIAAHFHGPAPPGFNAGVQVPIGISPTPLVGNAVVNAAQETDLLNGLFYINLHTSRHPGGEMRGQVSCMPSTPVGGELIPLDTTMILVAGAQHTAAWMIPVIVSGIGFAIVIARKF